MPDNAVVYQPSSVMPTQGGGPVTTVPTGSWYDPFVNVASSWLGDWLGIGDNGTTKAPSNGQTTNVPGIAGCAVTVPVTMTQRAKVPRGYVVVTYNNQKIGMLKSAARACGLWRPSRKPPIKASDWRCLQRANATVKKIDRVVRMANTIQGKAKYSRSRSKH